MESHEALPAAVRVMNEEGSSPFVLICEHASNFIPQKYKNLGLETHQLERHIAWDIGAEQVATVLSGLLDAPVVLANYSRLLIDLNRPPGSETSIPKVSENTLVPGNNSLSHEEVTSRTEQYFTPFHTRISQLLDDRERAEKRTVIIGIHSFTPQFNGFSRPWRAGVLYRKSALFAGVLIEAMGGQHAGIVHNEPYRIEDDSDYAIPVHGESRNLDAVLVELRQDLLGSKDNQENWAYLLARALSMCK